MLLPPARGLPLAAKCFELFWIGDASLGYAHDFGKVSLLGGSKYWILRPATNAITLPELKPGALRESLIVPSISSCDIAGS